MPLGSEATVRRFLDSILAIIKRIECLVYPNDAFVENKEQHSVRLEWVQVKRLLGVGMKVNLREMPFYEERDSLPRYLVTENDVCADPEKI